MMALAGQRAGTGPAPTLAALALAKLESLNHDRLTLHTYRPQAF